MPNTNQIISIQNEVQVLQAIGLVGWLDAAQIAKWVWGGSNPHSARVSADRVIRRLVEKNAIKRRVNALGIFAYVLTSTGALRANEGMRVELFRDGYDLSQLDVGRQSVAVDYLISSRRDGKTVFGAAAVRKGLELGILNHAMRGADGIVLDEHTGECNIALVVRNTHVELVKKAKRLKKGGGSVVLLGRPALIAQFLSQL